MNYSQRSLRLLVLGVLFSVGVYLWLPEVLVAEEKDYLVVSFLDVGQGDAIHVETPDGFELLIDGGPSVQVLRELEKGRSVLDRKIDVVLATHPDSDHISGLVDVLKRYDVDMVVQSGVGSDNLVGKVFAEETRAEGARLLVAEAGDTIQLGALTTVQVLSPRGDVAEWETNTASVVVKISYGENSFILSGDAPQSIENYLVDYYGAEVLKSDVLKLGHHGSKTSSSELFLEAVDPIYAVVSAGADNRYGHPHADVLDRTKESGAVVYNTASDGTITFVSDGERVWVDK